MNRGAAGFEAATAARRRPVPVAPQAIPFVAGLAVAAAVLAVPFGWKAILAVFPLVLFVLFFFRDPERAIPMGEGLVVAPADGRVTAVERAAAGSRVSIFLSVMNCHINRAPVAGAVRSARHTRGRFHPAWRSDASSRNERNHLEIETTGGTYGVTQIAGILARRIVCTKGPGDRVARGERIGMIRFGSRTDLHLPAGVEPAVAVGDKVRGGATIIAREAAARLAVAGGRG